MAATYREVNSGRISRSVNQEISKRRRKGEFVSIDQFISLLHLPYVMEQWQMDDIYGIIKATRYGEVCLNRSRNGSKTFDMVLLGLYFAYLGLDVLFYVAEGTQMEQPQKYLNELVDRTFLIYCLVDNKTVRSKWFKGGGSFKLRLLSEKKARSPRADVIIYDEEGLMEEEAYRATFGITKSSKVGLKIHSSTPVRGSIFHRNYNRLKKEGLVYEHKWQEIDFLNKKQFEADKKVMPAFEFAREYECSFEMPGGAVFTKIIYGPYDGELMETRCAGVDWNPVEHHYIVAGHYTKDMKAFVVSDVVDLMEGLQHAICDEIFERIIPFIINKSTLTSEDGGVNLGYADWLKDKVNSLRNLYQTRSVNYEIWTEQLKYEQVLKLMNLTLYIDPDKFPNLALEVEQTTWDSKSSTPKIFKNTSKSPHRVDALMHAASDKNWKPFYFSSFKV